MKFNEIKSAICEIIKDRYEVDNNDDKKKELLSLAHEDLKAKQIIRLKRLGVKVDSWKTIVIVEIEAEEPSIKVELKKAISWLATVKESLLGVESTDLYLFLAFSSDVSKEECQRIESTEQFCRKYVLLPDEEINEFVNRTFLQSIMNDIDIIEGEEDPIERAFSKTVAQYNWLTPKMQKTWKKAFLDLSGNELSDALLKEEDLI